MKKILLLVFLLFPLIIFSQNFQTPWPDSMLWWKSNNLRVMQTNLPAYEAASLDPDSLVKDLKYFSVNTLIINGGGIMAFYPTKLDFQYTNPYMKPNMLGDVIRKCHENGIRVITRFDFSRIHEGIFEKHPDWAYISPKGERITNDDMYLTSINAPYVQEKYIEIVEEVIDLFPIDGIFINMPGYHTRNAYEGIYYGIDQNEHDRKRFAEYSGGLDLPKEENPEDSVFQVYQRFKQYTVDDWIRRLREAVKAKSRQIAICTYMDEYVDIIRHETQTNSLPYWPYMASDNVNNAENSYPNHLISNASIQQISFRSRYNAIEPEETAIRLYENIANGSGLDMSMMGDFRNYEDERNFDIWREVYALHKQYEPYFGRYQSPAEICVVSPGYWPGGTAAQEYRGIQLMLKEAHLQFDIIENSQLGNRKDKLKQYKLIIIPQSPNLNEASIQAVKEAVAEGANLIATNQSLVDNPDALMELFGAKVDKSDHDGSGFYLNPFDKDFFTRFEKQTLLFWKFNLGMYDLSNADEIFMPILTPGRPGPPEKIGGHEPTDYYAVGIKKHPQSQAAILPMNLGRLYYIHGYEQHKNILLDVIDRLFPNAYELLETNAHPRVEVILQNYSLNTPENMNNTEPDGAILHLVNLTGFSGNTYFEPLPVRNLKFQFRLDFRPRRVFLMVGRKAMEYKWREEDGWVEVDLTLGELEAFQGVVFER